MKNKKYHFDMKSQNYQATQNHIYSELLEEDREDMMSFIIHMNSSRPEHLIDVLIPVLYSYCITVSMALDLRSSIEFFDYFRKILNGEMKNFITFLQLKDDAQGINKEDRRHGKEEI